MQDHKSFCELLILATELESRAWLLIWLDLLGGKTGPILLPSSVKHSSDGLRLITFAGFQHRNRLESSFFQLLRSPIWSHTSMIARFLGYIYYLCEAQ